MVADTKTRRMLPKNAGGGSGVVSCRLPKALKNDFEALARGLNTPISLVLKAYIEEAVRRGDALWWDPERESLEEPPVKPAEPPLA